MAGERCALDYLGERFAAAAHVCEPAETYDNTTGMDDLYRVPRLSVTWKSPLARSTTMRAPASSHSPHVAELE